MVQRSARYATPARLRHAAVIITALDAPLGSTSPTTIPGLCKRNALIVCRANTNNSEGKQIVPGAIWAKSVICRHQQVAQIVPQEASCRGTNSSLTMKV